MLQIRITIIACLFSLFGLTQHIKDKISVNGTVLGYTYDDTKSIFKKEKQIEVEGSLAKAQLIVKESNGKVVLTTDSDHGGEFKFDLPLGQLYTVTYSKNGYGTSAFELDVRSIPAEYHEWGLILINLDLILNNYESDKAQDNGEPFGRLSFDVNNERFLFQPSHFDQKKRLFKKDEDNTLINLMQNSIDKNHPFNRLDAREIPVEEIKRQSSKKTSLTVVGDTPQVDNSAYFESIERTRQVLSNHKDLNFLSEDFSSTDLDAFASEIELARAVLEQDRQNAVTESDFLNIEARERLLLSAETQLANARLFIKTQSETIAAQNSFIYALIGLVALIIILGVFVFFAYRSKRANLRVLAAKNHKIAESIKYATRIQKSVLLNEDQIKLIVPESFVFYQPLDAVSGDFYWFSKIGSITIMAAVDCTGHGVPGAFMSLIGNTLMNQIVNEKQITVPKDILLELHEGIVKSLNQTDDEESAQDGMDISVCTFDEKSRILTFSGANNSIYVLKDKKILAMQANLLPVGGFVRRNKKMSYKQEEMILDKGDRIYLFSDGYMDQFGGEKDEKFNIARFQSMLLSMAQVKMSEQESKVRETWMSWMRNQSQTDDILIVGIEV